MGLTLEERLNEIIEEKDYKIEELEEKIQNLESQEELYQLKWMMHEVSKENDITKSLPIPRFEMRLKKVRTWYNYEWHYGLVYKHYSYMDDNKYVFIPFGHTTGSGGHGTFDSVCNNGKLETPLRDYMHIVHESIMFDIPAFILCEEEGIVHEIDKTSDVENMIKSFIKKTTRK